MSILDELQNITVKSNLEDDLRKESLPLVMCGAGEFAIEVADYLENKGIELSDVFVDDEYYRENLIFKGMQVLHYSGMLEKYTLVNVVMGSSNYEKIEQLQAKKGINKVFYLFSVNYGVHEKTSLEYIAQFADEFEEVYNLFEDDASRNNYLAFLKTRVSGDNHYIIDVFDKESNFFNNDIFQINRSEVFLDVGAFDGDTIRLFLQESGGKYQKIYALEPDDFNRKRLQNYIRTCELQNVIISDYGAWNKFGNLYFSPNNGQLSGVALNENDIKSETSIMVKPLDDMFAYLEKITMLKINYFEGVKEALEGGKQILCDHAPKLAITVGFDCINIRQIPQLIKEVNPNYKLYLRYNRGMVSALTLYGII